jgi:hypothetical protein
MLAINYWFKGQVRTASLSHSNVYEWGKIVDALKKNKGISTEARKVLEHKKEILEKDKRINK